MELKEFKKATKKWSQVRTSTDKVLQYFSQGFCFKIEKSFYQKWKDKNAESLLVYIGIIGKKMKFILVDSESDKDPESNADCYFEQDCLSGIDLDNMGFLDNATDGNISVKDGLQKATQWNIFYQSWVKNKIDTPNGIFQMFIVPFSDLKSQFEIADHAETLVMLGLNSNLDANLILWVLTQKNLSKTRSVKGGLKFAPVEDLVCPCPPFY